MEQIWFGQKKYTEALALQKDHHEVVRQTKVEGFILGLEHSSVITCGPRTNSGLDLKMNPHQYREMGIEIFEVDRGGETTLHSPGQMVIYPILSLRQLGLGVREFVGALEEATILFFKYFGVETHRGELEPGIYSENGKIAFIGIRVDRGITRHGIALNIQNDLTLFQNIRSCGVDFERFDRLANHISLEPNAMQIKLFPLWSRCFEKYVDLLDHSPLAE